MTLKIKDKVFISLFGLYGKNKGIIEVINTDYIVPIYGVRMDRTKTLLFFYPNEVTKIKENKYKII